VSEYQRKEKITVTSRLDAETLGKLAVATSATVSWRPSAARREHHGSKLDRTGPGGQTV